MQLNELGCLQKDKDKDKCPKPWCQENEIEPEQVISTVATENKLDQPFDWRRCNSLNRIRNFSAYCKRYTTKLKETLKADKVHQAEQILFQFVQNENLPNVSKSIANSKKIYKTLNIAKLSPFIEDHGTIRVKGRLKHSIFDCNAKHTILLIAKHLVVRILFNNGKNSQQLRKQWLQYKQVLLLPRGNLIVFKEWLTYKALIHENL